MTTATRGLELRALDPEADAALFPALARLFADAYPILRVTTAASLAEWTERLRKTAPGQEWVAAERDGALVGTMKLWDFEMNVRGRDAFTGGVGSVAVAADRKRQGIAKALIAHYLEHYHARGAAFAILHPFKLDFYRALGFGYGTPVHRYRFATESLRDDGARGTTRLLGEHDADALTACYERVRATTNGLIAKHRARTETELGEPSIRYAGVEDAGVLRGYMQTSVAAASDDLRNRDELVVRDLIAEDDAYLAALLGYLRSQRDQFARVSIESQDPAFYLRANDPRDGSDESVAPPAGHRIARTGLGMMYRLLDVPAAFAHLGAAAVPFTLRVEVEDRFFAPACGGWTFRFGPHGAPRLDPEAAPNATLAIGIADLSSVVVGSLRLRDAVRNRLATLEPRAKLELVDAALAADQPPITTTRF